MVPGQVNDAAPEGPNARDGEIRLSRWLVGLHLGGVVILVLVLLSSVLWISAEHNKLALVSSENMVRGGIASFRARLRTLVRDYSIWDEAYAAVITDDRDWLYSNIGNAAAEIGTLDMIVFVPKSGDPFGWRPGSPEIGEAALLPPALLDAILETLAQSGPDDSQPPTLLAALDGKPWAFSATHVIPVNGPPPGLAPADLPVQVHGLQLSDARLQAIGRMLLIRDLALVAEPQPGAARIPLVDHAGATVGFVSWHAPRPGASILRQVTPPICLGLFVIAVVSGMSSGYAVRSARRLERALAAAKAADRSKTEFLSNVSHELRTPMNGILGVAQLLQTTELDAEQQELVAVLFSSAHAQMALISDLLDFSRMESGNRHLVDGPFEPASVLHDLAEMIRVAVGKKGIDFTSDCHALAGLAVRGDERAFRQIVTNLLGNAVKFTERGSVAMRAHLHRHGDHVGIVVEVVDTGRGIPPEALPHIFDRFFQADSSLTRSTEGTGLGLAISQSLARMMGGRIEVRSEPGVGSTFGFSASFPILDAAGDERDAA
jgi:signal transduction histidine kinase